MWSIIETLQIAKCTFLSICHLNVLLKTGRVKIQFVANLINFFTRKDKFSKLPAAWKMAQIEDIFVQNFRKIKNDITQLGGGGLCHFVTPVLKM